MSTEVFVRFQAAEPNARGMHPGVFGLANNLAADGLLSAADREFWRRTNDWYDEHLPQPGLADPVLLDRAIHPQTHSWFRSTAVDYLTKVSGYLDILNRHDVGHELVLTDTPGELLYEDEFQILAGGPAVRNALHPIDFAVRRADPIDLAALPEIERLAGLLFLSTRMPEIAFDTLPSPTELREYLGRCWVAVDPTEVPIGYLQLDIVDGLAHLEQLTVHPLYGRQGVGRALIDAGAAWARSQGLAGLSLTTFADVAWNAPYYRKLGFEILPVLSAGLQQLWNREVEHGLTRWPRVAMTRIFE